MLLDEIRESCVEDARQLLLGGEYLYELASARLDRLAELDYAPAKLEPWNTILQRYETIPWQWRPEYLELPSDALNLLEPATTVCSSSRGRPTHRANS